MKKLILVFCALLVLGCLTAFAEEAQKITLWEHISKDIDETGNEIEVPVKVTLTYKGELEIDELVMEVADGYTARISRAGVAPVTLNVLPADFGPHANLNAATEEQLQEYIDAVAVQFESGEYASEVQKTESGNVYLAVGDGKVRSVWMVYEDTILELIQFNDDFELLTAEDQNFAIELLQGIWME